MSSPQPSTARLKALAENIPNLLAVIVAVATTGWLLVNPHDATERFTLAFGAVATVLTLICTNQILEAIVRASERRAVDSLAQRFSSTEVRMAELKTSLGHLAKLSEYCSGALQSAARLIRCPTDGPRVYIELFGGFAGTFYAFNPGYSIESGPALSAAEQVLTQHVFKQRYESGGCQAHYLFLTGDEHGKHDLARFARLMHKVAETCPNVRKCLQVKQIASEPAASHAEIYFGTQHGRKVVVHELPGPMETHGCPSFYCVTESRDAYMKTVESFNSHWNSPKAILINVFDKPIDQPLVSPIQAQQPSAGEEKDSL